MCDNNAKVLGYSSQDRCDHNADCLIEHNLTRLHTLDLIIMNPAKELVTLLYLYMFYCRLYSE